MEKGNTRVLPEANSWDEVPEFASEGEEAAFWSSHNFGPGMTAEAEAGTPDFDAILPPPNTARGSSPGATTDVAPRLATGENREEP